MAQTLRIPYTAIGNVPQEVSLMPRLPIRLLLGNRFVDVNGLVDSGASVNVMPYSIGTQLGANWDDQPVLSPLGGSLSVVEVRALAVTAYHPELTKTEGVELLFAWARAESTPVIFGQINFFLQFDVCFFRTEKAFEITTR